MATRASVLGALAILGAGFNGMSFLNYGHDFSSMIMAGLWALALACYLTGMFLACCCLLRGAQRDRAGLMAGLPAELEQAAPLRDGRSVMIRPVLAADEEPCSGGLGLAGVSASHDADNAVDDEEDADRGGHDRKDCRATWARRSFRSDKCASASPGRRAKYKKIEPTVAVESRAKATKAKTTIRNAEW